MLDNLGPLVERLCIREEMLGVTALSRGRLRTATGALLGLALVVMTACSGSQSRPRSSDPVPTAVANRDWLGTVQPSGKPPASESTALILRTNGNFQATLNACESLVGTASFSGNGAIFRARLWDHSCPPSVDENAAKTQSIAAENAVRAILTGRVQWTLTPTQLSISKAGVGTIRYARGRVDPPSPDGSA
jgi:hypothetical protein